MCFFLPSCPVEYKYFCLFCSSLQTKNLDTYLVHNSFSINSYQEIDDFPYKAAPLRVGVHITGIDGDLEDELNTASKGRRVSKGTQASKVHHWSPVYLSVCMCSVSVQFNMSFEGLPCARHRSEAEI